MAEDYDVGYGRPPENTQFKPGQSGNPNGRPKGTKNLKMDLAEELGERIVVKEGGKSKSISKQRAMLKGLVAKAVGGDARAASLLLGLIERLLAPSQEDGASAALPPDDQAILERFLNRHGAGGTSEPGDAT